MVGDGKIWVAAVDSVLQIRTGERDDEALSSTTRANGLACWDLTVGNSGRLAGP